MIYTMQEGKTDINLDRILVSFFLGGGGVKTYRGNILNTSLYVLLWKIQVKTAKQSILNLH